MFSRVWRFVFLPLTYGPMAEQVTNPEQIYAPHTFQTEQNLWLVDPMYRTIHVADMEGEWLYHTRVIKLFSVADVCGDTLYLLPEDKSRVQILRFHSAT